MIQIKHNLKLLIISTLFAATFVYLIKNPNLFLSSVLNIQEIEEIRSKDRDIAYKTDNQILDVFLPGSGSQQGTIQISIAYDPSHIEVDLNQLTGQTFYTINSEISGHFMLTFPNTSDINTNESLFYVPYSGIEDRILIESASNIYSTTIDELSVGKLSSKTVHGN